MAIENAKKNLLNAVNAVKAFYGKDIFTDKHNESESIMENAKKELEKLIGYDKTDIITGAYIDAVCSYT